MWAVCSFHCGPPAGEPDSFRRRELATSLGRRIRLDENQIGVELQGTRHALLVVAERSPVKLVEPFEYVFRMAQWLATHWLFISVCMAANAAGSPQTCSPVHVPE